MNALRMRGSELDMSRDLVPGHVLRGRGRYGVICVGRVASVTVTVWLSPLRQ